MTAAAFSNQVMEYIEFLSGKYNTRLGHDERESIRRATYQAFSDAEARLGRHKIDGLEAVEWIKKYRNEFGTTLREAKDQWDRRVAIAKSLTV